MNNKKTHLISVIILVLCIIVSIGSIIALFILKKAKFENVFPIAVLVVLLFLPYYLKILFKVRCSDWLSIFYYIFSTTSLVLGSGWRFYDFVLFYDIYLHVTSGVILSVVAYSMLYNFQRERSTNLSPLLVFFFCVGFASFIGVIWEMIEFTIDVTMDMNMQIYRTPDDVILFGKDAIYDTMKDLISNTVGALITSSYLTYHSKKYNRVPKFMSIKKIESVK